MNRLGRSAEPRPLTGHERALFERVAEWTEHDSWDELTADQLRAISAAEGIDFATALLYERIVRSPEHGPFIERLESMPVSDASSCRLNSDVVIVPGAFYREYPHTGADGRLLREVAGRFGCPSEVIPLESFGSLARNARAICDWLAKRPARPVVLISLSKGGADVKMALAERDGRQAFRNVRAWINLCGLVNGTPLVSWIASSRVRMLWYKLLLWLRGYDFQVVRELTTEPGGPLDFDLPLPGDIQAIHVVGFPLERHLTNRLARRCFRRLAPLGPNDGSLVLADVCRLPGIVYPIWGADHYIRPASGDVRSLAMRIFRWLSEGGLGDARTQAADRVDLSERSLVQAPGRNLQPVAALHAADAAHAHGPGAGRRERRSHLYRRGHQSGRSGD